MQAWLSRRVIQHDPNPGALTVFPTFCGNAKGASPETPLLQIGVCQRVVEGLLWVQAPKAV